MECNTTQQAVAMENPERAQAAMVQAPEHVAKAEPIALISDIDTEQGSENNNPESVRNPSEERQAHRLFLFYSLGTL
jgi:hypothetical protein